MADLVSITYASRPHPSLTLDDVVDLALYAMRRNRENGVSGALWYHESLFVETIESDPKTVEALFARILVDPRHTHVTLLERKVVVDRAYLRWRFHLLEVDDARETAESVASSQIAIPVALPGGTARPRPRATLFERIRRRLRRGRRRAR